LLYPKLSFGGLSAKPGDPLFCNPNEGAAALIVNGNVGVFTVNTDCYGNSSVTTALNQIVTQPTQGTLTNNGVAGATLNIFTR